VLSRWLRRKLSETLTRLKQLRAEFAVVRSLGSHGLVELDLQLSVPEPGVLVADAGWQLALDERIAELQDLADPLRDPRLGHCRKSASDRLRLVSIRPTAALMLDHPPVELLAHPVWFLDGV